MVNGARGAGLRSASRTGAFGVLIVLAGCAKRPPPDFAPDPLLVADIAELRMRPLRTAVCPGQTVETRYEAILRDGRILPFEARYDEDRPPALHVVFLSRTSPEAIPEEDGGWDTDDDPLLSALDGFRLTATMRARPDLSVTEVVTPEYSCLPSRFRFQGRAGGRGGPGGAGPDVVVRLDLLASPFYERLLVVGIEVGGAPPFYLLADADAVPAADWLVIESVGGPGGRGPDGAQGVRGSPGAPGCPGGPGGAGGAGEHGGQGGSGGSGGPITVIVPSGQRYLAGLVNGVSPGGPGGAGGRAGPGGEGGPGGKASPETDRRCAEGPAGPRGPSGRSGQPGAVGSSGPPARVIPVSDGDVFGHRLPHGLAALVDYARRERPRD
jgi:hypothetical protein